MAALDLDKKSRFNFWYILIALWGIFLLHDAIIVLSGVEQIPYSDFLKFAREGKLEDIIIEKDSVRGSFKQPQADQPKHFVSVRVDPALVEELSKSDITYRGVIENTFLRNILSWILPSVIFFGLWLLLIRKFSARDGIGGSFLAIGKSKAKVYVEESTKVTLADVAGVDEAKEELQEIIAFLKNPTACGRLGGRLPKGILLVGPPGTGKTLLARAVAGEAGVPFFSISGSEFVEMFVGVGAARVRDLFEQARLKAPCIVFIDELDALGRARGISALGSGNDEKEQTLNQLLSELDGFDPSKGVVLLAATNRPEILDPALLRAGRFDRQILVDKPDKKGRIEILAIHAKKITLASDVSLEQIASLTPGFSGADLANLVNEAALLATRRNAESVAADDFTAAIERIVAGLERKNRILSPQERKLVAHHEMGHALVALSLKGTDPVVKISIIPRGIGALGYTIQRPTEDRYVMSMQELKDKMVVLLGGRAAEQLIFGSFSTGAADDLSRATEIARSMVMRFGMDQQLGAVAYENDPSSFVTGGAHYPAFRPPRYSDETAYEIDRAVKALVNEAFEEASKVLTQRKSLLEEGARLLLEKETLTHDELQVLIGRAATETVVSQKPRPPQMKGGTVLAC